ncbi:site-specific DNA-methyltransferase [bacterium]|nr:site-specific DNA-methyltransferase [bacterium]
MKEMKELIGDIHCSDTVKFMNEMPEKSVDLIVTSPPYGVGIDYDSWDDDKYFDEYMRFTREWLSAAYRVLRDDGRIAVNIPYEINRQKKGGRIYFSSEVWQVMKQLGFGFFGIVDLEESSPHRSKTTAWGSWMSPSAPYIYNPKECVILAYKNVSKKQVKGTPQWEGEYQMVPNEKIEGEFRKKLVYDEKDKKDFMSLVFGQWNYFADTQQKTKATFSLDIPYRAIKILSYKEDVVFDPFNGSGTTCLAAEMLGRPWLGCDISPNYVKVAQERLKEYKLNQQQLEIVVDEHSKH